MFVLKVIDSNNEEYEILKTKSQIDMDRFTTFYETEEELVEDLFFEKESKVKIFQTISKNQEPISLPFTNIKCRNMIYDFGKREYFERVVNYDTEVLKAFFHDELLRRNFNSSNFEKEKNLKCQIILGDIRTIEEPIYEKYQEKNKKELKIDLDRYFEDYYSSFKNFYKYITDFYPEEEPIFTKKDIDEHERLVDSIKNKIHVVEEEPSIDLPYEDELESISSNPLASIDDKYIDLDIYLDSKNTNEEDKDIIIQKQMKKL